MKTYIRRMTRLLIYVQDGANQKEIGQAIQNAGYNVTKISDLPSSNYVIVDLCSGQTAIYSNSTLAFFGGPKAMFELPIKDNLDRRISIIV